MRRRLAAQAALGLVLLLGSQACGAPQPVPTPTQPGRDPAAAYADCLEEQGLVMEEYTTDDGATGRRPDKERNELPAVEAASRACADLAPVVAADTTPADPDYVAAMVAYAECIREHGVPEFPDPDPVTGDSEMDDATAAQVKNNPALLSAMTACDSLLPGSGEPGTVGG